MKIAASIVFCSVVMGAILAAKQNKMQLQLTIYEIATVHNMTSLTHKPNCPNEKNQLWSWTLIISYVEELTYKNPWVVQVEAPFFLGAVEGPAKLQKDPENTIAHFTMFYGRSCSSNETDTDFILPCDSNANVTISNSITKSAPILQTFCDDKIWVIYSYKWIKP